MTIAELTNRVNYIKNELAKLESAKTEVSAEIQEIQARKDAKKSEIDQLQKAFELAKNALQLAKAEYKQMTSTEYGTEDDRYQTMTKKLELKRDLAIAEYDLKLASKAEKRSNWAKKLEELKAKNAPKVETPAMG